MIFKLKSMISPMESSMIEEITKRWGEKEGNIDVHQFNVVVSVEVMVTTGASFVAVINCQSISFVRLRHSCPCSI